MNIVWRGGGATKFKVGSGLWYTFASFWGGWGTSSNSECCLGRTCWECRRKCRGSAVERIRHTSDGQGQILALAGVIFKARGALVSPGAHLDCMPKSISAPQTCSIFSGPHYETTRFHNLSGKMRFHEERKWIFEEPTRIRISLSIIHCRKIKHVQSRTCSGCRRMCKGRIKLTSFLRGLVQVNCDSKSPFWDQIIFDLKQNSFIQDVFGVSENVQGTRTGRLCFDCIPKGISKELVLTFLLERVCSTLNPLDRYIYISIYMYIYI